MSEREQAIGYARGYQAAASEASADLADLSRKWDIETGALRAELARLRAEWRHFFELFDQMLHLIPPSRQADARALLARGHQDVTDA
jgi:hypothetical protein